ncbi:hypothetical protein JCM8097_008852 [Rhodosporidiobolus ruineniae]
MDTGTPRPPPRTSSLQPTPPRPSSSPAPPPLGPPPALPPPPLAWPETQLDILPSYDQAVPNPPHRFPRWGPWIEKRAQERREERQHLRQQGLVQPSSWDLPDHPSGGHETQEGAKDWQQARDRDERAEKRLSGGLCDGLPHPGLGERSRNDSETSVGSGGGPAGAGGKNATHRLTKNVQLERVGGRFSKGLPDKPLCGLMLPTKAGVSGAEGDERFILVGTREGLYLVDLVPSLSSSISRLSTATLSASSAYEDAAVLPLWTGLPVHQLEVFQDSVPGRGDSPKGIVLGLVGREGEGEVRMWSLSNLVSLAKWRVYDQNSIPLHLPTLTSFHYGSPPAASTSSSSSSAEPFDRRASLGYAVKSIFSPTSTPPKKHSDLPGASPGGKGKGKAGPLSAPPAMVRQSNDEAEYLLVDSSAPSAAGAAASSSSAAAPGSSPVQRSTAPATTPTERVALPLEWAVTSAPLPLPKGHSPALFFRLFRMPSPPSSPESEEDDDDDEAEEDLTPAQRRRRKERRENEGRLFLFIATAKSVFLYESRPGVKRSWQLTKEFFAPSTPKFLHLLHRSPSSFSSFSKPSHRPTPSTASLSASPPPVYPPTLHLLLGLSSRLVLVRLSDSSVREVELVLPSPSTGVGSPPSHAAPLPGRARSGSAGSTASSTFSFSGGNASRGHRSTASTSLANLAAGLKESLKDSAVVGKLASAVEKRSGRGVPAGMASPDGGKLQKGRRLRDKDGEGGEGEGRASLEDLLGGPSGGGGGKWTDCQEVVVPPSLLPSSAFSNSTKAPRRLLLLTRGGATHVFPLPLQTASSSSGETPSPSFGADASASGNTKLPVVPLHTFLWPSTPITHLSAAFSSVPLPHSSGTPRYAHVALTAYTTTGLHVQEGLVGLSALSGAFSSSKPSTPSPPGKPFFRPLPTSSPTLGAEEDDDADLSSTASLDFGRETGFLSSSGGGGFSTSATASSASFLWTRGAGQFDWAVKRVVVRSATR